MFDTETILIVIALATAIVGTLWQAKFWGKTAIIALAIVAAGTAILESQKKAAEVESTNRNLELIIRAVQPPKIFDDAVLNGFRTVATKLGLFISNQTIDVDSGARVFTFKKSDEDDQVSGIVFVSIATRQRLFAKFAQDQKLVPLIRDLTTGKWGSDDLDEDWDEFLANTGWIVWHALKKSAPPEADFKIDGNPETKEVITYFRGTDGRSYLRVTFNADFMKSLLKMPPIERGRLIYEKSLAQVS